MCLIDVYVKWCVLYVCDDDVRQCLCFVRGDHNGDAVLDYLICVLAN